MQMLLINWTEQGVHDFKDTVDRYEAAKSRFETMGVTFESVYWTLGERDIVCVVRAPDDESVAAATLALAGNGSLRSTTMRAFSAGEMRGIIAKTQ